MVHFQFFTCLAEQFRHFARKDVIEHIDFPEDPKSIFEGLVRFEDKHLKIILKTRRIWFCYLLKFYSQIFQVLNNPYNVNVKYSLPLQMHLLKCIHLWQGNVNRT